MGIFKKIFSLVLVLTLVLNLVYPFSFAQAEKTEAVRHEKKSTSEETEGTKKLDEDGLESVPANEDLHENESTLADIELSFNSDGGSEILNIQIPYDSSLSEDIYPVPNKEGYIFDCWTRDGEIITYETKFTNDSELKAMWEKTASIDEYNPDYLTEPDEEKKNVETFSIEPLSGFKALTATKAMTRGLNKPPIIGVDHPENPGDVVLFKEVKPVPGEVNTWEVTLRIEAMDDIKTSDIVLVMDTSGSMGRNQRLQKAKEAANSFVDTLLTGDSADTTRISLIEFNSNSSLLVPLTTDKDLLHSQIDSLSSGGGTFTQSGVRLARGVLDSSLADYKNIIVLSDGNPTFSYQMTNPDDHLSLQPINGYASHGNFSYHWVNGSRLATDVVSNNIFTNNRVGNGLSMFHRYYNTWGTANDKYYNHGNGAISEAGFAKDDNYNMWSIGLETNATGDSILSDMASTDENGNPQFYEATPGNLQTIFDNIAGKLKITAQNVTVSDPMGGGFEVPIGDVSNITVTQGTFNYDSNTNTIDWQAGNLTTPLPAPNEDIKYAELKYKVKINDDILNEIADDNGNYPVNRDAQMSYENPDGNTQTVLFPVPKVDPLIIIIEKKLLDSNSELITDDRAFDIKVTSAGGYDKTYSVKSGERKVLTDIKLSDTYTVNEVSISDGSSLTDYDTSYDVAGIDTDTFEIDQQNDADRTVTVTNKEKKLGKLTVKKIFKNTYKSGGVKAAPLFGFQVTGPNGFEENFSLGAGEEKTFENLAYGDYTVTETNTQGFVPTYSPGQTVGLSVTEKEKTVTVTNSPANNDYYLDLNATKKWVNGPTADHTEVTLEVYRNGVKMDPQPGVQVTPGNGESFDYIWEDLLKYDTEGNEYEYTVEEANVPPSGEILVNGNTYTVTEQDNTIINTYVVPKIEVTGVKEWIGVPEGETAPTVQLQLYKNGVAEGDAVDIASPDTEYTWSDLDETDASGNAYTYTVDEVSVPIGFTKLVDGLTVKNTYSPEKIEVTGEKEWIGVPEGETAPTVQLQLYKNGVAEGDAVEIVSPDTEYTWSDLDKTDASGNAYTYTVDEVAVPTGFTKVAEGLKVTNTYSPEKIEVTGVKEWIGVPEGETAPTVQLQLYKNGVAEGDAVDIASPDTEYTWSDLDKTDASGNAYTYTVDEVAVPTGFTKVAEGLKVTNTYSPEKIEVTGEKEWIGVPEGETAPTVQLQLYKNGVAYGDAVEIASPDTEYTWSDLDKTDASGNAYTYTVDEVAVPTGFTKEAEGLKVTNTYSPEKIEVTGVKEWIGVPEGETAPTVQLQLYKNGVAYGNAVDIASPDTEYTWSDLDKTDASGNAYTYTVDEVAVPTGFTKEAEGLKVTNTYSPEKIEVTGVKEWIGVPEGETAPTVQLQLYKNGVAEGDAVDIASPDTEYTWSDLDKTDASGNAYTYTVDEVAVPTGFTKEASGLTVKNTYSPEKIEVTGVKEWIGVPEGETAPTVQLQLYKNGVAEGDAVDIASPDTEYTWSDLDKTDASGNAYTYTVDEVAVPTGFTKVAEGLKVTNTYSPEKIEVTGVKEWIGVPEGETAPTVQLQLYKNGVAEGDAVDIASPDTEYTWSDLDKTDASGNAYTYTVDEVAVPTGFTKVAEGLKVTNTYSPEKIEVTGVKEWIGVPEGETAPTVQLQLYKNGVAEGDAIEIASPDTEYTWSDLDKTDASGNAYTYTVDEVAVPENYSKKIDGLKIINTYIEPEDAILSINTKLYDYDGSLISDDNPIEVKVFGPSFPEGKTLLIYSNNSTVLEKLKYGTYYLELVDGGDYNITIGSSVKLSKLNKEGEIIVEGNKIRRLPKTGNTSSIYQLYLGLIFVLSGFYIYVIKTNKAQQ